MISSGQQLAHPILGGIFIKVLKTSRDTGGAFTLVEEVMTTEVPRPAHLHTGEERFTVRSGRLTVWIGSPRHIRTLGPGEQIALPPRVVHNHWNPGPGEAHLTREMWPAGNEELFVEALVGMEEAGKTNKRGLPRNLFELALLAQVGGLYPAGLPLPLMRVLVGGLARIARWRGYRPWFPQYTGATGLLVPLS
jgi:mannose-6-phosphate isomerase-like protein (cupin superfamily)